MKQREIKFKAWDIVNSNMEFDVECLGSLNEIIHKDKYVVIQYTGFKDKNEKDIYEGDIVYFKANYSSKRNGWLKGIFIYNEENYYKPSLKVGYDVYEVGEETDEFPYTCEVLGNIYENPNLLV